MTTPASVDDFNRRLSDALKDVMAEHDINQTAVARLLDRSQGYVSHRVNCRANLSADIIGGVAHLAHISGPAMLAELTERMWRRAAGDPAKEEPNP